MAEARKKRVQSPYSGSRGQAWEVSHVRSSVAVALKAGHGYSWQKIADQFTRWDIPTAGGNGEWSKKKVRAILDRWQLFKDEGDHRAVDYSELSLEDLRATATGEVDQFQWAGNSRAVKAVEDWRWEALDQLADTRDPFNWTQEELTSTVQLASLMRGANQPSGNRRSL